MDIKPRDIFAKCVSGAGNFAQHSQNDDNYLLSPILEGLPGPQMMFQGKPMLVWTINDYLGLAQNPQIKATALQAVEQWSTTAPMGARLMSGNRQEHIELEKKLAQLVDKEEAMLFIAGYLGVMGTLTGLVGRGDSIVIDQFAHACMIDAAFLAQARSGVKVRPYKHNDMHDLERQLQIAQEEDTGRSLIVTEGVFGMRGDLANLPDICALKAKYQARLFVDDAHGLGVLGSKGKGIGEHYGLQQEIDVYFSTFAKAFVSIGGFTAAPKEIISYLRLNSRPAIFSKVHPLTLVKTIDKATDLIINGEERRRQLWEIAQALQSGLKSMGYEIGPTESPITPIYVRGGDVNRAIHMLEVLREKYGIFVTAVTAPVVPPGVILFRLVSTAAHTMDDVKKTLSAFAELKHELTVD